jgi:uncharacterized membrane protein
VSAAGWEMLDLVARWVHVIAGIMWVGNSLLFNWLDRNLHSKPEHYQGSGAIWLLHSGGFYYVEKTLLPGQKLPVPLHWFKWQAYTTWLSGLGLLVAVYWVGGRATMQHTGLPTMHQWALVVIAAGILLGGWLTYELANRLIAPRAPTVALAIWLGALMIASWLFTRLLDPRAAWLHVGAMLGTIMAGNVFFTIVPSQRHLVSSVERGEQARAVADSARAKRVSIHNNYFTFPVIALMVSNHFPSLYGAKESWQILLVLIAGGAAVRHILNVRYTMRYWQAALALVIAATLSGIHLFHRQGRRIAARNPQPDAPVTFAEARHIIDRRCAACHSATPTDLTFGAAPGGVTFDTPEEIGTRTPRILERAVVTKTMPPANKTRITDVERDVLRRWISAGAPLK